MFEESESELIAPGPPFPIHPKSANTTLVEFKLKVMERLTPFIVLRRSEPILMNIREIQGSASMTGEAMLNIISIDMRLAPILPGVDPNS